MKKVVIIGCGPAGLFAANELAGKFKVVVLDSSPKPGGSGLRSDGKLNFHPEIGGNLLDFMDEDEAWKLLEYIEQLFVSLGAPKANFESDKLERLKLKAAKAGVKFIPIRQSHIGSDELPVIIGKFVERLEKKGVEFRFGVKVLDLVAEGGRISKVVFNGGSIKTDYVLAAPGRSGSEWLTSTVTKLGVKTKYNPIDIGVRVEVPAEIFDEIVFEYKSWDPKFHIYTPSYDDFVRTFCVSPRGYVIKEFYEEGLFGVNGHSFRRTSSNNTNFAFLVRVSLTEPLENTMLYGKRIAQITNTLGGGKPIIQRLGDLIRHRRSTWDRIKRSYITPTLKGVTPGDIAMAYPHRIIQDIIEGLERLDRVVPGVFNETTLLYAPEIKFYAMRIETSKHLQTAIKNLFVAGDGAGVSRGIVGAAATGIIAARGILRSEGISPG